MSEGDRRTGPPSRALIALGIVAIMAVTIAAAVLISALVVDTDDSLSGPLQGVQMVYAPSVVTPFGLALVEAKCPAGKVVTGGGTYSDAVASTLLVLDSTPVKVGGRYAWRARFSNKSGGTVPVGSVAICATRPDAAGGLPATSTETVTSGSTATSATPPPTTTTTTQP
jgi:hypothetical protein